MSQEVLLEKLRSASAKLFATDDENDEYDNLHNEMADSCDELFDIGVDIQSIIAVVDEDHVECVKFWYDMWIKRLKDKLAGLIDGRQELDEERQELTKDIQSLRRQLGYTDLDNTPQARIERALDAMSETGFSFGEMIADVMEQNGFSDPRDAGCDENWARLLETWTPR